MDEGTVYDWDLQQNIIIFQLTHDKAIRICNGVKVPQSRLKLPEFEKIFAALKGKRIQ